MLAMLIELFKLLVIGGGAAYFYGMYRRSRDLDDMEFREFETRREIEHLEHRVHVLESAKDNGLKIFP